MKYVSIDTETTGLHSDNCQVIEFGAVIDDLEHPLPIVKLPRFQCYIRHHEYRGSAFALQMNHKILARIAADNPNDMIINPDDLVDFFERFLLDNGYDEGDKFIAAGKNFASFDWPFLKNLNIDNMAVAVHYRMLDPMSMYITKDDIVPPDMEECQRRAGLKPFVAHNAIDDAYDVIRLIRYKLICQGTQILMDFEKQTKG